MGKLYEIQKLVESALKKDWWDLMGSDEPPDSPLDDPHCSLRIERNSFGHRQKCYLDIHLVAGRVLLCLFKKPQKNPRFLCTVSAPAPHFKDPTEAEENVRRLLAKFTDKLGWYYEPRKKHEEREKQEQAQK